ncbi:hypothetical protein [Rhizobium sp. L1K21]|uniref:hypothetical protein n=1 Tax=Rhizobium sp. L1K21 TaxID=2954933 RepID=UPI002092D0AF|nr:hypothetical protein [Rhizobium sp. L1K21]MCO6185426.1 hypothetical protein [Rhizobium sp. L1K21]
MSSISFAPLLPWPVIAAGAFVAAVLIAIGLRARLRGAWLRATALVLLLLAICNPSFVSEIRDPLSSIVAIVVDKSQSQQLPERQAQTDMAVTALQERLSKLSGIEPRVIEVRNKSDNNSPSTQLFTALTSALSDLPPTRIGGAVLVTDGQVHDIPDNIDQLGFNAPVHALITGREDEFDRRVEVVKAPRFGLVKEPQELTFRVVDDGKSPGGEALVTVRLNGEEFGKVRAVPGREQTMQFTLDKGGENVLELQVAALPGEVTATNNTAVHVIDGIRQNLRVLLVSGAPHMGERAWRNLLKSDTSVDLVHFTILRPPEKQDGTPINELSLIAFPTRELFVDKINDFDLIIFDRYQHRGVLPILYYDYIGEYVRNGGALLVAAGPEYASTHTIADTPLADILPALPTGNVDNEPYYPRLSDIGRKHPVTRGLRGADSEPPAWDRWFRTVDVNRPSGETVMVGANEDPLLVLNHEGEGRVAMLLSDQGWLWERGYNEGGPHVALYRRIAHWLMKEPELEEEALTATSQGLTVEITRQTLADSAEPATVKLPSGESVQVPLTREEPGLYRGRFTAEETGLLHIQNGDLTTLLHLGAVDAPEFKAEVSTTETLQNIASASHGIVQRLADGDGIKLPQILPVRGQVRIDSGNRMVFRLTDETVLKGINTLPLFTGLLGLAALLMAVSAMWWREGR